MTSVGTVRSYFTDEGWGVIDSPDVPGGCWVGFSAIAMAGYRRLVQGQRVSFRAEPADQDGYAFRAVKVWTGNDEPPDQAPVQDSSGAYRSWLSLTFDNEPTRDQPGSAYA
ncbi:cold shock domain-containing protein [Micromonospora sp. NPDC049523]|uniref:cold-shock protein n=1 Tax=Micromonospora sp. NPDC049523 TaxID=3155921 RepID=UPI0034124796